LPLNEVDYSNFTFILLQIFFFILTSEAMKNVIALKYLQRTRVLCMPDLKAKH